MKKFRFRLERLLWLREQAERQQAAALGSAMRDEARDRQALECAAELERRAAEQAAATGHGGWSTAGARAHLDLAREAAGRAASLAEDDVKASSARTEAERETFSDRRKDRRAVERLREKRQGDWTDEAGRDERRTMDEAAQRPRSNREVA